MAMWDGGSLGPTEDGTDWRAGGDGYEYALWFGPPPWWKFWTRDWDWVWLKRRAPTTGE